MALIMSCWYPFPREGIPCPSCKKVQRTASAFNLHARKAHKTTALTPTSCLECDRNFPSYKSASAHYSRSHKHPSAPEKSPQPTLSPPEEQPPLSNTTEDPATSPLQPSSPPEPSSPPSPVSTQEIIRQLLDTDLSPITPQILPTTPSAPSPPTTTLETPPPLDLADPIRPQAQGPTSPKNTQEIHDFLRECRLEAPPNTPNEPPSKALQEAHTNVQRLYALIDSPEQPPPPTETQTIQPTSPILPPDTTTAQVMQNIPALMTLELRTPQALRTQQPPTPERAALPSGSPPPSPINLEHPTMPSESDTSALKDFRQQWLRTFQNTLTWEEFEQACQTFALEGRETAQSIFASRNSTNAPRRQQQR